MNYVEASTVGTCDNFCSSEAFMDCFAFVEYGETIVDWLLEVRFALNGKSIIDKVNQNIHHNIYSTSLAKPSSLWMYISYRIAVMQLTKAFIVEMF